jgi:hypothetical protein
MTDEQRLQLITEQLIIVRDNLFRGLSKSMQKLQAKSINEVLGLPNYTESSQKPWVGLTESERRLINYQWQDGNGTATEIMDLVEAKLEEKNT